MVERFDIRVLKRSPEKTKGKMYQPGRITIGDFTERFWMPYDYWNIDQYKKQWKEGIARLKNHDTSCLVTAIKLYDDKIGSSLWVLYKEGDTIFIQNHARSNELNKELESGFPPYEALAPRTIPQHGRPDEWSISVQNFFASQQRT